MTCAACSRIACVCAHQTAHQDPGPGATLGDRALLLLAEMRAAAVTWDAGSVGAFLIVPAETVRRIDAAIDDPRAITAESPHA